jgi:hypothetical protein
MTQNNINQLLSKKDKIQKLSDEAIKDIYSRQIILKIAEKRKGYIKQESDLFKGLNIEDGSISLYEAIRDFDIQLYTRLNSKDCSIEEAIIKEFTKDTSSLEDSKADIMRYKLEKTSECSGVPKAVLVHDNINKWAETEKLEV